MRGGVACIPHAVPRRVQHPPAPGRISVTCLLNWMRGPVMLDLRTNSRSAIRSAQDMPGWAGPGPRADQTVYQLRCSSLSSRCPHHRRAPQHTRPQCTLGGRVV